MSISTDSEFKAEKGIHRFRAAIEYYFEEDEGEQIEDERLLRLKYDRYFNERTFATLNTQYEVDKSSNLDLRTTYGVGIGHDFIKRETTKLSAEIGLNTVNEEFSDNTEDDFQTARWAVDYSHTFGEKKVEFFHNHQGFQNLEDVDGLEINSKTGLRFPLMERLKLSTQINIDWDNQPAPGARSEDIKYLLSLGYSFGNP